MCDNMSIFGRVIGAAGVHGHYGEGHWQYLIPGKRPNFTSMAFVSKTATLLPRQGNVKSAWRFWEIALPSWARVHWTSGHTLNIMGLPGKGIRADLGTGLWQSRTEPFFISIMAVETTLEKRLEELQQIINLIAENVARVGFKAKAVGLQINRSCPNTGHDFNVAEIVKESEKGLEIASALGWPLVEKFAIDTAPAEAVKELQANSYCHGICVSNTVKYGYKGLGKKIWGKEISPLAHLGGGGISGPELRPLVCDYIKRLRDLGFTKNINGLGEIFHPDHVNEYRDAGADSVGIGTVATHHPGNVQSIIARASQLEWRKP